MPLTLSLRASQESLGRNHRSIKDRKDRKVDSDFGPSSDEKIHEAERFLASKKKNMKATDKKMQQRRVQEEEEEDYDDDDEEGDELDESASLDTMIFHFHETSKSKKSPKQRQDSSNTSSPSSSSPLDSFSSSFLRTKATDKKNSFNQSGLKWTKSDSKRDPHSSDDDEVEERKRLRSSKTKLRLEEEEDDDEKSHSRSKQKVLKNEDEEEEKEEDDWLKPMPRLTKLPKPKPSLILPSTSSSKDQKKKAENDSFAARPASPKKIGLNKTSTQPLLSRLQSPRKKTAMPRLKSPKVHAIKHQSTFGTLRPSRTTGSAVSAGTLTGGATKMSPLRLSLASSARISMKKSKNKRRESSSSDENDADAENHRSIDDMIHKDLRQLDHMIRSSYQKQQQKEERSRSRSRSPRRHRRLSISSSLSTSSLSPQTPPPTSRKLSLRKSIEDIEKELRASTRFCKSKSQWSSDEENQEENNNHKSRRNSLVSPSYKRTSSFKASKMPPPLLSPLRLGKDGKTTRHRRSSFGFKPQFSSDGAEDSFTEELRLEKKKRQLQKEEKEEKEESSFVVTGAVASDALAEKIRKTAEEIDKKLLVAFRPFNEVIKSNIKDESSSSLSSAIMPSDLPEASRTIVEDLDAAFASFKQKAQDFDQQKPKEKEVSKEDDQAMAHKRLEKAVKEYEEDPPDQIDMMVNPFEALQQATRRKIQEIEDQMVAVKDNTTTTTTSASKTDSHTIQPQHQRHQRFASLLHSHHSIPKRNHLSSSHVDKEEEVNKESLEMVVKEKIIDELDLTIMKLKHKLCFDLKEKQIQEKEREEKEQNQKEMEKEKKKQEEKKQQDLLDALHAKRRVMGISHLKQIEDQEEEEEEEKIVEEEAMSKMHRHRGHSHLKQLMKELVQRQKKSPYSYSYEPTPSPSSYHHKQKKQQQNRRRMASVNNLPDFFDEKNVMKRFEMMRLLMMQQQQIRQPINNQEEEEEQQQQQHQFMMMNKGRRRRHDSNKKSYSPGHPNQSPPSRHSLHHLHDDQTNSTGTGKVGNNQTTVSSDSASDSEKKIHTQTTTSNSSKSFTDTIATFRSKRKQKNHWFRSYENEKNIQKKELFHPERRI